jgi:hypothetical protein
LPDDVADDAFESALAEPVPDVARNRHPVGNYRPNVALARQQAVAEQSVEPFAVEVRLPVVPVVRREDPFDTLGVGQQVHLAVHGVELREVSVLPRAPLHESERVGREVQRTPDHWKPGRPSWLSVGHGSR